MPYTLLCNNCGKLETHYAKGLCVKCYLHDYYKGRYGKDLKYTKQIKRAVKRYFDDKYHNDQDFKKKHLARGREYMKKHPEKLKEYRKRSKKKRTYSRIPKVLNRVFKW